MNGETIVLFEIVLILLGLLTFVACDLRLLKRHNRKG